MRTVVEGRVAHLKGMLAPGTDIVLELRSSIMALLSEIVELDAGLVASFTGIDA
jgi:hypothetical protein